MYEPSHAFCDKHQARFVLSTMTRVAVDGTPVDPDSGEDYRYFGPVLWESRHESVAIDSPTRQLAIIAADGGARILDYRAELEKFAQTDDTARLGIVIEGGLVQAVISDRPGRLERLRVFVIDRDVEGALEVKLTEMHCLDDGTTLRAAVRETAIEPSRIDLRALSAAFSGDPPSPITSHAYRWQLTELRRSVMESIAAYLHSLPEPRLDLDEAGEAVDLGDPELGEHMQQVRGLAIDVDDKRLQASVYDPVNVNEETWHAAVLEQRLSAEDVVRLLAAVERTIRSSGA